MTDRPFPHSLDNERSVLGAILVNNETLPIIASVIDARHFFRDAHRRIYEHCVALEKGGFPIDLVTLTESLKRTGDLDEVSGPAYVASLVDGVPHSTNAAYYARLVREDATKRELIVRLSKGMADAYAWHGPTDELVQGVSDDIAALTIPSLATVKSLFTTALDTCRAQPDVPMLLEPYLPAGVIASIVAKIKTGKTSLLLEMVRCLRHHEPFCGNPAPETACRVLYATEQPQTSFVKQLQDAGLHGDEGVIVTYLGSWMGRPWREIGPALTDEAIRQGAQVLVIDTDSRWFGFKDDEENRAGSAGCVDVLRPYVAQGGTVILSRHGRKSGGGASDAGRGSSAIDGAVDLILHLQKPSGQPAEVRELDYAGRFEMPERLTIRRLPNFQHQHPIEIGSEEVVSARYVFEAVYTQNDSPKSRIKTVLATGAKTVAQLAAELGISNATVARAFKEMGGEIIEVGKGGTRKNAILYGLKERTSSSFQSLRNDDVEVGARGAA